MIFGRWWQHLYVVGTDSVSAKIRLDGLLQIPSDGLQSSGGQVALRHIGHFLNTWLALTTNCGWTGKRT